MVLHDAELCMKTFFDLTTLFRNICKTCLCNELMSMLPWHVARTQTTLLSKKWLKYSHLGHECITCIKVFSLVTGYNNLTTKIFVAKCVAHAYKTFKKSVTYANSLNYFHFMKKYSHFWTYMLPFSDDCVSDTVIRLEW